MTVYLDLVLIENILMNILIIYLANYISKKKASLYKICISSIIGAVYYVVLLLPETQFLNFYLYKIVLSIIMVSIGFSNNNIFDFITNIFNFYLVSFVCGGAMYGIYHCVFSQTDIEYYPVKILLLGSIVLIVILKYTINKIRCVMDYKKLSYYIDVYIDNRIKRVKAFLDTGNSLKDPITNKPVVIICLNSIKDILPKEILDMCSSGNFEFEKLSDKFTNKIRILPYQSIGNENGIMVGYKSDKIHIQVSNNQKICIPNCLIGINTTILKDDIDIEALLSIEVLEYKGGASYECNKVKV